MALEIATATGDNATGSEFGATSRPIVLQASEGHTIVVPNGVLFDADYTRAGGDLILSDDNHQIVIRDFFVMSEPPRLESEAGARIEGALAARLAGPAAAGQYAASDDPSSGAEPIGKVADVTGDATATRIDGTKLTLAKDTPVFEGDLIETAGGAAVKVVFIDESTFSVGENGRMVLDELVFDRGTLEGSSSFSVIEGVFVFVSGGIAENNPDQMVVKTPVATLGVRGTAVAVQAAEESEENLIILLPEKSEDGEETTGSVKVTNDAGSVVLDEPNEATALDSVFALPGDTFYALPEDIAFLIRRLQGAIPDSLRYLKSDIIGEDQTAADLTNIAPAAGGNNDDAPDEVIQATNGDPLASDRFGGAPPPITFSFAPPSPDTGRSDTQHDEILQIATPQGAAGVLNLNIDEDELPGGAPDGDAIGVSGAFTGAQIADLAGADPNTISVSLNSAIEGVDTGLDSLGFDIIFTFDGGDPTQLLGVADGRTVFTLVQDAGADAELGTADDLFTFTLLDSIDHTPNGTPGGDGETIILNLTNVFATTDADDVTTVVGALSTVTIENDVPVNNLVTVNLNVDEDELPGGATDDDDTGTSASFTAAELGSLVNTADKPVTIAFNATIDGLNTGLDSEGFDILFDVVSATQINGVSTDNRVVFTLVQEAGEDQTIGTADDLFTFTLLDRVDHTPLAASGSDAETITLNLAGVFVAKDFDGDSVLIDSGATIAIENDVPAGNGATLNINVVEDGLTGLSTGNGGGVTSGTFSGAAIAGLVDTADGPVRLSLNAAVDGASTGLDSKGFAITFDYVDATHINGVTSDTRTVFTLVQDDGADNVLGTADDFFTFALLDQIDHTPNNQAGTDSETIILSLTNVFAATDFDGDRTVLGAGATVTIENDIPVNNSATVNIGVVEDGLTGLSTGNGGGATAANFTGAQIAGLVNTGADELVKISLNAGIDNTSTGLNSNGVAVSFDYIDATHISGVTSDSRTVFTLVQDDGADNVLGTADDVFTFTLLDQIDHANASGDAGTITLALTSVFAATDFDGDRIVIDAGATVTIENDIPANNSTTVNASVVEDGLAGGLSTGNGGGTTTATFSGAQIASLVNTGADEPIKVSLNGAIDNASAGLSSKGIGITFDYIDATHVNGVTADARTVFTLEQDDGADNLLGTADDVFTFTLLDQIDHTPNNVAGSDSETIILNLINVFAATDFDGDRIVIDEGATVTIENDTPVNNSATVDAEVDEDELSGGISDGDNTFAFVAFTGAQIAALVNPGADEAVKISFNAAIDGVDTGLDSLELDVAFDVVSATQINGVTSDGRTVFTLVQDDGADNIFGTADDSITFTLVDQVDHASGSGDAGTIVLNLASVFAATDFDGDRVVIDAGATVTIENDVPVDYTPNAGVVGNAAGSGITEKLNHIDATGADAPASIVFSGASGSITALNGVIGDGPLAQLNSGGQGIWLAGAGTDTLIAFVDSDGDEAYDADDDFEVFTLVLDPSGDTYSLVMHGTIDNGVGFEADTGAEAGQHEWMALNNVSGVEEDQDLLLTGLVPGEDTINTSGTGLGSNAQSVGPGTGVRVDFVTGSNISASDFDQFSEIDYTGHYKVNDAGFFISQIQGNDENTPTAVKLSVYDEAHEFGPVGSVATDLTDDPAKTIIAITVVIRMPDANDVILLDHVSTDTTASGVTVNFDEESGNKSVTVSGLQVDYEVLVTTADGFERLLIENFDESTPFDVGGVVVGTTITNDPITIGLPTTLTDSDGDTSSGTIDFALLPQLTGDDSANTLNGASGTVDEVLVGNGGNDTLNGGGGNDILYGGAGNDALSGGPGINVLTGGADADRFYFQNPADGINVATNQVFVGAATQVTDFQTGQDAFAFLNTAFGFSVGTTGTLADVEAANGKTLFSTISNYNGTGVTEDLDQPHFIFDPAAETLYFDADVTTPGYTVIADVQAGATVTASDIQIV